MREWKLEFNPKKSVYYSLNCSDKGDIVIQEKILPKSDGFIYLGLPIGNEKFIWEFLETKMRKCERAFYSLRGLGCKIGALSPKMIAYFFKQYCQPIVRYGLENLYVTDSRLRTLNIRQNVLLKSAIGLSSMCRSKPLFHALTIEKFAQLYYKHKVFFLKQILCNSISKDVYDFLYKYYIQYSLSEAPSGSFLSQLCRWRNSLLCVLVCLI